MKRTSTLLLSLLVIANFALVTQTQAMLCKALLNEVETVVSKHAIPLLKVAGGTIGTMYTLARLGNAFDTADYAKYFIRSRQDEQNIAKFIIKQLSLSAIMLGCSLFALKSGFNDLVKLGYK